MKQLLFSLLTFLAYFANAQKHYINKDFNSGTLPAGWTNKAVVGTTPWQFGLDGSVDDSGSSQIKSYGLVFLL